MLSVRVATNRKITDSVKEIQTHWLIMQQVSPCIVCVGERLYKRGWFSPCSSSWTEGGSLESYGFSYYSDYYFYYYYYDQSTLYPSASSSSASSTLFISVFRLSLGGGLSDETRVMDGSRGNQKIKLPSMDSESDRSGPPRNLTHYYQWSWQ